MRTVETEVTEDQRYYALNFAASRTVLPEGATELDVTKKFCALREVIWACKTWEGLLDAIPQLQPVYNKFQSELNPLGKIRDESIDIIRSCKWIGD